MSNKNRPYRMRRRAELEARTRLRITQSAIELHGTLGPSRTSISAVAKHAGVRRSTVYRHFPNERALLTACSSHWMAANPLPDITRWVPLDDEDRRLRKALQELYAYYRGTERMMDNVLRDEAMMPLLTQMLGGYRQYLAAAQAMLMQGRNLREPVRRHVHAAIGHALAFHTWRSLAVEHGLEDTEIATLMSLLVVAAAAIPTRAPKAQGGHRNSRAGSFNSA